MLQTACRIVRGFIVAFSGNPALHGLHLFMPEIWGHEHMRIYELWTVTTQYVICFNLFFFSINFHFTCFAFPLKYCVPFLLMPGLNSFPLVMKRSFSPLRKAATFSRQSAHKWRWGCKPYAPTTLYPQGHIVAGKIRSIEKSNDVIEILENRVTYI
jgi:hypothetical protein